MKIRSPKLWSEDEYCKLPPNQVYLPVPAVAGAAEKIQREGGENALSMSRIFSWLLPLHFISVIFNIVHIIKMGASFNGTI